MTRTSRNYVAHLNNGSELAFTADEVEPNENGTYVLGRDGATRTFIAPTHALLGIELSKSQESESKVKEEKEELKLHFPNIDPETAVKRISEWLEKSPINVASQIRNGQ